ASGLGAVLYVVFWAVLPRDPQTPGAAPASRDVGQLIAFASLALGALVLVSQLGGAAHAALIWPAVVMVAGAGLTWQRSDAAQRERFTQWVSRVPGLTGVSGGRLHTSVRLIAGGLLVLIGVVGFFV